ncbi:putative PH and SEC7 domain-containing protein C11E3.11c [Glarea lozoyensis 74030]|uniref:Putative PH and SEC7 domain-containing protein C11E3.11c n=1 Tax=Glarea lozoyensis (strain ATCC 74030 / MF5533) TaxID=1104152 RepID=H0EFM4_GLAL7|nr:putative PH and SEC7 domain-containing protein C11E3.11c [Glarea lozoyensis 74030]
MGEEGVVRARTLIAYMELKLVLKAESQQVDRILDAFAQRWCQCNPKHGFKVTDLHMADIEQKMTRSQFIKNTMPTIRRSVAESAPNAFETRPSVLPGKSSTFDPVRSGEALSKPERTSIEVEKAPSSWRTSFKPPVRSDSEGGIAPTPLDYDTPMDDCGPLVKAPFHVIDVESVRLFNDREEVRIAPLLEDESLELAGSPWAKEGILKHKHHLEALGKKAKDRNWNEVFAVVEKGYLSLFSFSSKSMRNKSKGKAIGGVVGGGNWQENAESLGSFLLRQTIASALPSPGYSKARPHVWALSLPTGAVHLFQVGTPDIVKEFVSTANYWIGGISNIEYGWSESIVNNALVTAINDSTASRPSTSGARPSMQSSLRSRSSVDHGIGGIRARLPGDKISISDWSPPTQSMRASNLMEADQLQTLSSYVAGIEEELQKHNQLRSPMLLAFTPRHPNAQKAMANWEKKSSYLLREIVKFRTYIDCLTAADACKQKVYAEREAERALAEEYDEGDITLRPE